MTRVILFGSFPVFHERPAAFEGLSVFDAYVPVLLVFVLAMLALVSLPIPLATYRELGVLRRMSNTPVQPPRLLAAQLVVNLVIALLSFGLITALAAAVFEVRLPRQAVGLPITLVLTAAPLVPLGLCVAAVARTARAAATIGNVLFFVLAFCAGLWLPQQVMPDLLRTFTEATPTGAAVQALNDSMRGQFPSAISLGPLAAYSVVFAAAATRTVRWE